MIGELPEALEVCGKRYPIHADYRNVLHIFEAFQDDDLTPEEKAWVCISCLYKAPESIPPAHLEEAIRQAYWFCDGGDIPKSEQEKVRTMDWKQDAHMIFPAVSKTAGYEVRSCPFLHWWVFLGLFGEIGEGLFSTVMHIRQKKARSQKLEKWEKEFLKRNKNLVQLRSAEDQEAIEETEAFLRTIT